MNSVHMVSSTVAQKQSIPVSLTQIMWLH